MNMKILMPVLIALHVTAAALIVDGLGVDEGFGVEGQDSERLNRAWQVVEWNPACVAGHANGELSRYWSNEYRQLNAAAADTRTCVNVH